MYKTEMTEQLIYRIYKITNSIDDKIYIGSTHLKLKKRMDGHRKEARKDNKKTFSQHMKNTGIQHFNIELIKEIQVATSNLAKIQEQVELWAIPIEKRLNSIRAHIPYKHYRGDIEGKRQNRMDYYYRQKQKPEWVEKERQRNKKRMRIKRQLIKNNLTKNKKILLIVDKFSKI
tara:strand:- start:182 stop:703 length:522 start_codon:yes stop_codon:yes gene_type:complete